MLFEKDDGDNCGYTSILLAVGWCLGALLAVGIFLVGSLPTCTVGMVEHAVIESHNTSAGMLISTVIESSEECFPFAVAASSCTTIGILLWPAILITIVVLRKKNNGEDICASDVMGMGIVTLGTLAGFIGGVGLILLTKMDTNGGAAGGAVLLIFVVFSIWITVMLSKCYQQCSGEDNSGHTI